MYSFIRPFLFLLEPEQAHALTLSALHYIPGFCFSKPLISPIRALGLDFPHPIGLAAGLDKNAEHLDALAKLGFSFIEVGTVTPKPQAGNPKPRLFRLPQAHALINRMGFNNLGVDRLVENVRRASYQGILGINIGKNKDTALAQASVDYLYCLQKVYPYASYITVNISSPNTPDLRQLQSENYLRVLISQLREEQLSLADTHKRYVPLVIKLSPDESEDDLRRIAETIMANGIDGIIATNTTCSREGVQTLAHGGEMGGLSGAPLEKKSSDCLRLLKQTVGDAVTLIGVGGIDNAVVADEKLKAGATLLQIYTGLIYKGPGLIKELIPAMPKEIVYLDKIV